MLGKADATPMIAVKDLDRARQFYEETLGLKAEAREGLAMIVRQASTPAQAALRGRAQAMLDLMTKAAAQGGTTREVAA